VKWQQADIVLAQTVLSLQKCTNSCNLFFKKQQPPLDQGLLIIQASRSHFIKTHHTR